MSSTGVQRLRSGLFRSMQLDLYPVILVACVCLPAEAQERFGVWRSADPFESKDQWIEYDQLPLNRPVTSSTVVSPHNVAEAGSPVEFSSTRILRSADSVTHDRRQRAIDKSLSPDQILLTQIKSPPGSQPNSKSTPQDNGAKSEVPVEDQQAGENSSEDQVSVEQIQKEREATESSELSDDLKSIALGHYDQALDFLKTSTEQRQKARSLREDVDRAEELIKMAKAELEAPLEFEHKPEDSVLEFAELEQIQLAEENQLADAEQALATWEDSSKKRKERIPQLPAMIEAAKESLEEAKAAQESPPASGEHPQVAIAHQSSLAAQIEQIEAQLDLYLAEQTASAALKDLYPLQRDKLVRLANVLKQRVEDWQNRVADARRAETQRQAEEARLALQNAHPAIRDVAQRNTELTDERTTLQEKLAEFNHRSDEITNYLDAISLEYIAAQEKVERSQGHLTTAVGLLLRNQRNHLPDIGRFIQIRRQAASEMASLQSALMTLEDERDSLGDIDALAEEISLESGQGTPDELKQMALETFGNQRQYLGDLIGDYNTALRIQAELEVDAQKLVTLIEEYTAYVDERILWIRSAPTLKVSSLQEALSGAAALYSLPAWQSLGHALASDIQHDPWLIALLVLVGAVGGTIWLRYSALMQRITTSQSKQPNSLLITIPCAVLLTIAASVWLPMIACILGWRMQSISPSESFGAAVGFSLVKTAIFMGSVEVLRECCRDGGIAESFLNWPKSVLRSIDYSMFSLIAIGSPLTLTFLLAEQVDDAQWLNSLGRIAFIIGMVVVSFVLHYVLTPKGAVWRGAFPNSKPGMLHRMTHLSFVIAPLLLGILAGLGYLYTATELLMRLQLTLALGATLIFGYGLSQAWISEARIRLQRQVWQFHAFGKRKTTSESDGEETTPQDQLQHAMQIPRLVKGLTLLLFLTGLWVIWMQVLPAAQVVTRYELWRKTTLVTEVVDVGDGNTETKLVTRAVPVTLGHLILAMVSVAAASFAARHLRAVLEFTVFTQVKLDEGIRHALNSLLGYLIWTVGIIFSCQIVGIGWSSVQWLVAALTVGLGFGLQEIFANFVSGLILLLERPVRVGDVVTIDNVTGTVSRIHIRATTVTDYDKKEYIVPNKEFVTGRLMNWTLSNQVNRVLIPVGIAYGSDPGQAREILTQIASEHPLILKEPPPTTTFDNFGDSALNLTLRCYLPELKDRLQVITELNTSIHQALNEAGIEIPFPQLDLHMPSAEMTSANGNLTAQKDAA